MFTILAGGHFGRDDGLAGRKNQGNGGSRPQVCCACGMGSLLRKEGDPTPLFLQNECFQPFRPQHLVGRAEAGGTPSNFRRFEWELCPDGEGVGDSMKTTS